MVLMTWDPTSNVMSKVNLEVTLKTLMVHRFTINNILCACVCMRVLNHVQLFVIPQTVGHQTRLSMEFSKQEYWRGLPFSSPENLPEPGIKCMSVASHALAGGFVTTVPPGKPHK